MNEKKIPQIKVFVYQGRVEAVYGDTSLVDVEIIECASSNYDIHGHHTALKAVR